MEASEKKQTKKNASKCMKHLIIALIIIAIVIGIPTLFDYYGCPHHHSYNRPGVKSTIETYLANSTQTFGEVFIPQLELTYDNISLMKYEGIPSLCPTQYGIWYIDHSTRVGPSEKLIGLVQIPNDRATMSKEDLIKMVNKKELLVGGITKETVYHNYSWNDLDFETQQKLCQLSETQNGDKFLLRLECGKISITQIRDVPAKDDKQTLIAYLEETPFGLKKKEVLIQGWYDKNHESFLYGGCIE